ncbi:MAG: phosphoglycerate kinase, partial [Chloroflexi bacterium]|nr:phosphoglycerate kinase [Chloroflexota bacterium]
MVTEDANIPSGWIGVDIGPKTEANIEDVIERAKTIVWNGPMGKFETDGFDHGTMS